MRIALDATYSIDPHPSGIAIYSSELLSGLAHAHAGDEFVHCYRARQFTRAPRPSLPNVRKRLLLAGLDTFSANLFHSLNQRVDRRHSKRVVSTFHDLFVMTGEYSSPEFRARFSAQARHAARKSDLIIAVSEFTASQITDLLGVERSRIRIVPHGVNLPDGESQPKKENVILFVGALQTRKNVERLVEAFEGVADDWRLILVGAPTGYQADIIIRRIERSGARSRIGISGYVTKRELESLYSKASIFAFPSLDEGFGIPVLEAMAHGIPVITSNRSALPEVAGNAALLVNPYDTEELGDGLARLTQDPELRDRLSDLGRSRAASYTWNKAVEGTYSVYRELLG